ncbi:MAG TPA: MmgE/PrpD family protein [Acidimicrobiales bacterium]|nr:MmgE/PrpD family protein [Acidimicrobiales bacterium]
MADEIGFTVEVAARAAGLSFADLPPEVVTVARQCVLDWLGVTLAGSTEPAATILLEELLDDGPADRAAASGTVVGRAERLGPRDAALVNGTASHALDYDDVNDAMFGHPTVPVLPGVLALAEGMGASGADLLCAFVAGYEAECQIGRALGVEHYRRGFHSTAINGALGAAAACSRLMGLSPHDTAVALGIAATEAAGLKSMFGTMCKPLHAGQASAAGLLAARLAGGGFTSRADAVETDQGLAATHTAGFDPRRGLAEPPGGWHILSNLFKYHAACFQTHSAIEGLRRLRDQAGFGPDDVESVVIHAEPLQMGMCAIPEPSTGLEVKFSLRHTAAFVLAGVDTAAIGSYRDENAREPSLVGLRQKVEVVDDRTSGRATPIEVRLRGGEVLTAAHDVFVPEADLALQGKRLEEKFLSLAEPIIGASAAGRLVGAVSELAHLGDVRELMAETRPSA